MCDEQKYKIRNLFYTKHKINNIGYDINKNKFSIYIKNIVSLFKTFGILFNDNELNLNIVQTEKQIKLNLEFLKWNNKYNCYEYTKEVDTEIEIIFSILIITENPYMIINHKIVPFVSFFDKNVPFNFWGTEWDIALNIIPKLEKMG